MWATCEDPAAGRRLIFPVEPRTTSREQGLAPPPSSRFRPAGRQRHQGREKATTSFIHRHQPSPQPSPRAAHHREPDLCRQPRRLDLRRLIHHQPKPSQPRRSPAISHRARSSAPPADNPHHQFTTQPPPRRKPSASRSPEEAIEPLSSSQVFNSINSV
ncbi:hypothetical protein Dimus_020628 [Dionaea muscipula]